MNLRITLPFYRMFSTYFVREAVIPNKIINNVSYSYDPVTKMHNGWWLTGVHEDQRSGTEREYHNYMKIPKITSMDDVDKIFNNESKDWKKNFHGRMVYTFSPELRDEPEILSKAINGSRAGWCICIMSDRIQRDPEMAKMVLRADPTNIGYLRHEHLGNYDVMKTVAEHKEYGNMIREASLKLRNNENLASIGLSHSSCLSSFGPLIKDNETMVRLAMKRNSNQLMYASPRLRKKLEPWSSYLSKKLIDSFANLSA